MRYFLPGWPRALIVVALSILAVNAFDLTAHGVAVTGTVPTGLFSVSVPQGVWGDLGALIAGALSIIFVGYSETLAAGRAMASKHGYELDTDQELIALGASCGAAGLVGGFVTDGSLSKTSVADAAGQRSQMASLINATFVLLTMLFLAALFDNLPAAALGAIVIDAMIGLIEFRTMRRYYRVSRSDWVFFMAAGLGIIFFSIIQGIVLGVVLSLLLLIGHASRPALRKMGRDPHSDTFLDTARHEGLLVEPAVLVLRLDGPLFFADANRFRDDVNQLISTSDQPVRGVVVDMEAVSQTDTDGADVLIRMAAEMRAKEIWFGIARVESMILDRWDLAGAIDAIGRDHVFGSVREASDVALTNHAGDSSHEAG
jgi:Sulfate permease and related transporters (MFS superfamily)